MRTIKFRGKRDDGGGWVYGSYFNGLSWADFIIEDAGFEHRVRVIPETVGQFTGLHDKNGKEIYEGDFLVSPFTGEPVPVIYDQEYCQFTFGGAEFGVEVKHKNLEVIGNIYENPEYGK